MVWDFASDDFYLMKGGVRLCIWWLLPDERECENFTSDDFYLMKAGVGPSIWFSSDDLLA
jgi:hypothetical protein